MLRLLYPDGIRPEQYDDSLAVVRIIDKLFRIANNKDAFGESPYKDIAGYAILGMKKSEIDKALRGIWQKIKPLIDKRVRKSKTDMALDIPISTIRNIKRKTRNQRLHK